MLWVNDVVLILSQLPIPVYWDINSDSVIAVKMIDDLLARVKNSMESTIHAELNAYSRTHDLLLDHVVIVDGKWVHKVMAFRLYLQVQNNKHQLALTHAVLSGHVLTMEQM
jgi:hypothetical protein